MGAPLHAKVIAMQTSFHVTSFENVASNICEANVTLPKHERLSKFPDVVDVFVGAGFSDYRRMCYDTFIEEDSVLIYSKFSLQASTFSPVGTWYRLRITFA
jgi:hypothetical protein